MMKKRVLSAAIHLTAYCLMPYLKGVLNIFLTISNYMLAGAFELLSTQMCYRSLIITYFEFFVYRSNVTCLFPV